MPTDYLNPQQIDTDKLWESVVTRDRYADGRFVFGVKTTGIFCRPTCPARRPNPENVEYFPDSDSALEAGYRACKRCHPLGKHPDIALVEQVRQIIEEQIDEPPTLAMIGADVGMSPYHVQRVFKRVTGISPNEYARARRIERFKDNSRKGSDVTSSLYDAGYGSSSRLYEDAPDRLGMTPGSYRRGGEGMHISYTIIDTNLGRVLIGATERGVCAISMADDDTTLIDALYEEYPRAEITESVATEEWINAVRDYVAGIRRDLDVPLDLQATAFRWRVWQELRRIPAGQTRTYSEVAAAIGDPNASRAVAGACASNPAALVIPCHRVVRADGKAGGYRWGTDRKRRLLEQESALASD